MVKIKLRRCRACGQFVSFNNNHKCLKNAATLQQANDNQDEHDNQEDVNQSSCDVEAEAEHPADKQDND